MKSTKSTKTSRKINNFHIFTICLIWSLCTVSIALCETDEDEISDFKLVPSMNEVVHYVNDSFIVLCQANNTRLRWIDSANNVVEHHRGRVSIEHGDGHLALIFSSISTKDNGNWTCEAEEGNRKLTFHMIVYKPITFVDTPNVQSVRENEEAIIKCMVTGDPEPTISWYYNGQPLNMDEEKYVKIADGLLIKRVFKNDSGEYTCKAFQISSAMSSVQEQTIRLNIQHKPIHLLRRESADLQYGYIKGLVNITCEAEAEPPAKFKWYRHDKQLSPKHHQIITGQHISVLQLYLNDSDLFGEYVCEAKNYMGTLKRTITLVNGTKPQAPPHIMLRGLNSNTFDIDVGARRRIGDPHPMDITGYRFEVISRDEHRTNGGKWANARVVIKDFTDGVTYLINNLAPNTTYLIRVASRNPAGQSDWMGPQEFTTKEKQPFGHPNPTTTTTTSTSAPPTAIGSSVSSNAVQAVNNYICQSISIIFVYEFISINSFSCSY